MPPACGMTMKVRQPKTRAAVEDSSLSPVRGEQWSSVARSGTLEEGYRKWLKPRRDCNG